MAGITFINYQVTNPVAGDMRQSVIPGVKLTTMAKAC